MENSTAAFCYGSLDSVDYYSLFCACKEVKRYLGLLRDNVLILVFGQLKKYFVYYLVHLSCKAWKSHEANTKENIQSHFLLCYII